MSIKNTLQKVVDKANIGLIALTLSPIGRVLAEGEGLLSYDIKTGNLKEGAGSTDMEGTFVNLQSTGRVIVSGITGLAAIVLLIIFILRAVKLGQSGDNPSERQRAIQGLIYLFIAIALLGGASVITSMFWGALKTVPNAADGGATGAIIGHLFM